MSPRRSKSPPKSNPLIAVAYLRVSTDDQSLGLEAQRAAIERWALAQGVRVVAWFEDHGVSGATAAAERPGLLQALAGLTEHKAGALVAAKRDRLARDVVVAATVERLAVASGARVVTADGVGAHDGPEGELMRTIVDAIAAYERALIRARTKAALQSKKARGERVGSVPFGMRTAAGKLEPDPAERAALARMRELAAAGLTHKSIATTLASEGHAPRGERWHPTTVARALRLTLP